MKLSKKTLEKINEDKNKCIDCKLCFNDCPMMREFGESPKELMQKILNEEVDLGEVSYSCMLCGLCYKKCPKDINLESTFYEIRKSLLEKDKKEVKNKGYNVVRFHQINSFTPIFSKTIRKKESKAIFLPGCSLSSYSKELVMNTYEYLKGIYEDIGITFKCCGKPTLAMGDIDKFDKYYSDLKNLVEVNNIEEIIVACPNCYKTIGKTSKNVKVTSVYEIINEFGVPNNVKDNYSEIKFAVHDSCSVRNEKGIQDSVRNVLKDLGVDIVEFKNNRENTVCCGAGGMVGVTNTNLALRQMIKRGNETSCENIVCYCESCCESLINSDKNVLHLLDLVFNQDVIDKKLFTQDKTNTINKWKMRYKTVKSVK
ncbi:(Fe-S)-binding protein [Paraclostridium bifermentans]|uniref:(Fe-S)-binding protein n=1 Tax=Paraclostridium bifermentans TaxID=1490 RepID=UPI00359C5CEF